MPPAAMLNAIPPRKKRRARPPIQAKFTLEPDWRGDVGYVSEDLWKDLFGPLPRTTSSADAEDEEVLPDPPVYHLAVALSVPGLTPEQTIKQGRWTTVPVTLPPPTTSQFPALPPSTVLFPDNAQSFTCLSGFKASLPPAELNKKGKKSIPVLLTDVDLVGLETLIISVSPPHGSEYVGDEEVEEMVRMAVRGVKVLHRDDVLRLGGRMRGREAKIEIAEPVDQGVILLTTKIVVVKDNSGPRREPPKPVDGVIFGGRQQQQIVTGEGELEEEDDGSDSAGITSFFKLPTLPGMGLTGTPLRNGVNSKTPLSPPGSRGGAGPGALGKNFKPQPLVQKIPPEVLHPRPKDGEEDEEARVYVDVKELLSLGTFSGDWVGISLLSPVSLLPAAQEMSAKSSVDKRKKITNGVSNGTNLPNDWEWRPVRIYSLPDSYSSQMPSSSVASKSKKGKGAEQPEKRPTIYISPILLANLTPSGPQATALTPPPELHIFPLPFASNTSSSSNNPIPPAAKEVTLLRIASPTSTDRALQPSLLLALKTHFESARRLVKKGDLIAVTVDEVLARSLFGEEAGGVAEELLLGQNFLENLGSSKAGVAGGVGEGGRVLAWFKVGNIAPPAPSGDDEEARWGGVVYVDPATTRMAQAGSDKRKIPPTIYSSWEYYLNLRTLPLFLPPPDCYQTLPPPLRVPYRYVSAVHRRLRELISAATSPRAIHLNLPPISILITSTQRSVGKRTIAMRAAADVGVHMFHIDAYDIVSEGNNGDVKTEAFLRARVDRALACGKENTVLLISHVEAFAGAGAGGAGGGGGKIVELLKEVVSGWRVIVGTTGEVEKIGDSGAAGGGGGAPQGGGGIRGVFTHELEISAPDEGEREGLLKGIVEEKGVVLGEDVQLSSVAVKTAALVAGDLVDVVERAVAGARERVSQLVKRLANSPPPIPSTTSTDGEPVKNPITVRDLHIAGGDEVRAVLMRDFEAAVEAARRNFADSIGAPKIPNVSWDDVGGLANVKSAVMETIQLPLERPELFARGMKKRSGILFYGPPGTGKTLLAKAIATEFSLNFFSVKGPELLNMYIGESEANVRRVFQRARDARPCVVFFDELDSVAPKRGNQGDSGGVMDRIVSQLLAELDGMSEGKEGSGGVFVVGATNRPDLLDAALLRPGRFDKMLYLGVSDTHDKQLTILEALTRKFTLHPELSLRKIAEGLPFTYTGADLYALCSDAMLKAITRQAQRVEDKVQETRQYLGRDITTGWWFDHEAGPEDVKVLVEEGDFIAAGRELVGSVSAKELEHYDRVRRQFELTEAEKEAEKKALREENANKHAPVGYLNTSSPKGKGKGKGKAISYDSDDDAGYASLSFPPERLAGSNVSSNSSDSRLNLSQLGTGSIMEHWKKRDGELSSAPEDEDEEESVSEGDEPGVIRPAITSSISTAAPRGVADGKPNPPMGLPPLPKKQEQLKPKPDEKSLEELDEEFPMLPTIREEDEKSDLSLRGQPDAAGAQEGKGKGKGDKLPGGFTEENDDDEELYGGASG